MMVYSELSHIEYHQKWCIESNTTNYNNNKSEIEKNMINFVLSVSMILYGVFHRSVGYASKSPKAATACRVGDFGGGQLNIL